ncbi:MAG: heme ABC exporter ATP-binding protein CcmA [Chloroflexota bacterium]
MITVRKLIKRFGPKTVLRDLDFEVEPGEFVALLGPNGAGKTTFLRILASLSRPALGEVRIAGYRLPAQAAAVRRRLGVVSHQPLLYGDLTAEENLRFYGRLYAVLDLDARIAEVLGMVGLYPRRRDLVRTFSRGMQQRLAIGRAVLHDPEVMLFDEPHTGLDQDAGAMLDTILQEVAARGRTVVMTSHDLSRAAGLASRFDVLSQGVIVASARRGEIDPDQLSGFYRNALERENVKRHSSLFTLQSPTSTLQSPTSNLQSPTSNLQSPTSTLQSPIPNPQSPIPNPQSPLSNFLRALWAIVWKDLASEWRSRELLTAMLVFALLVILIFNFALELDASARASVTSGVL